MSVQEMQQLVSSNATLFTPAESQALLDEIRRGDPMTEMIFEYYATNGDREFLVRRLKNAIAPKLLSNAAAAPQNQPQQWRHSSETSNHSQ